MMESSGQYKGKHKLALIIMKESVFANLLVGLWCLLKPGASLHTGIITASQKKKVLGSIEAIMYPTLISSQGKIIERPKVDEKLQLKVFCISRPSREVSSSAVFSSDEFDRVFSGELHQCIWVSQENTQANVSWNSMKRALPKLNKALDAIDINCGNVSVTQMMPIGWLQYLYLSRGFTFSQESNRLSQQMLNLLTYKNKVAKELADKVDGFSFDTVDRPILNRCKGLLTPGLEINKASANCDDSPVSESTPLLSRFSC